MIEPPPQPAAAGPATPAPAVRFAPERTTLAVVVIALLGSLPLTLSSRWFAPLLLLPVLAFVWVLRARVVGTQEGVEVCNGLRVRRLGWPEVDRFELPRRGPIVLHPLEGRPVRLTAMSRRDLRPLIETGNSA